MSLDWVPRLCKPPVQCLPGLTSPHISGHPSVRPFQIGSFGSGYVGVRLWTTTPRAHRSKIHHVHFVQKKTLLHSYKTPSMLLLQYRSTLIHVGFSISVWLPSTLLPVHHSMSYDAIHTAFDTVTLNNLRIILTGSPETSSQPIVSGRVQSLIYRVTKSVNNFSCFYGTRSFTTDDQWTLS